MILTILAGKLGAFQYRPGDRSLGEGILMDEQKIQSNLKKLAVVFIVVFLLIGGVSHYLFQSVTNLYEESIQGRLAERAVQYNKSFVFKMNADLQTLRAMACMLADATIQDITPQGTEYLLWNLWDAGKAADFVRLCYFPLNGESVQLNPQGQLVPLQLEDETEEMQYIIQHAMEGKSYCSQAFYDPVLGYNTLGYATPILTGGKISGVLACSVSTESYSNILSSVGSVSDVGAAAVLSEDGKILASTRTYQTEGFYELEESDDLNDDLRDQFAQALLTDDTQFFKFEMNGLTFYACVMAMDAYSDNIVIVDTDQGISDAVSGMVYNARMIGVLFAGTSLLFVMAALLMNRRYHIRLRQSAYHDRLTGAYNRHKFFQLLDRSRKKNMEYTAAAINIRKFKYINELFSPDRSNQLLKDICNVLKSHMEAGEFFCRDTADTFVLALKTLDQEAVSQRLECICEEACHCSPSIPSNYPIVFYCGCASTVDCVSKSPNEELMSHVMLALSNAKQTQRANIAFYDASIHEKEKMQNYIENHMEAALQNGEFQMYLQPKMDLQSGKLSGAEALVRWLVGGKQIIFPDQFIPVFERNGFCIQLDYYMVEQACKQIRSWMDAGLSPVPISVNQTKLLFYEENYVERICAIAQRYDVASSFIVLEILEGLALENPEQVSQKIRQLHDHGFRVSMDDFGSGYASLTTLSQLPIDELKLDRSFLLQADHSTENNRKILEVVIEAAKRLKISTVAEGIETADHVQMMQEMHCDYGQGYYYSKPISAEEFTKSFLEAEKGPVSL